MTYSPPAWKPLFAGDCALILEFGQRIEQQIVREISSLNSRIESELAKGRLNGVQETVSTFRSIAIVYDPLVVTPKALLQQLEQLEQTSSETSEQTSYANQWNIPVCYGGIHGPDLAAVAQMTGLEEQVVLDAHSNQSFTVYMLGFLPGFAFLGDTPVMLHLPRKSEPRLRVPAGSVAIASQLTGIYPWESPGGWHILGNSPVPLFNAQHNPPALFKAGDMIKFRSIDVTEHEDILTRVQRGDFRRSELLINT